MPRARVFSGNVSTPAKTPVKIPLNDDRKEKANRLHSRQAQHEIHMNQIKLAATPMRKRRSINTQSPRTPADGEDALHVSGSAVTPMKRVPILANFEEWMKLATDNKINATNSWNFALIDYFHDMSLLKEGDGVNFQRASCTLDGCVKIYTNRVDSVATETSKLLTGLADNSNNRRKGEDGEGEDGEDGQDGEEGEDGSRKKSRKRAQRSEATLATSFAQLQLKKMELEFAIDPLFKKASADFDEGGAKGLLLNHLAIDGNGRIVFDSSDDAQDTADQDIDVTEGKAEPKPESPTVEIDLQALGAKFFPNLSIIDEQDICPSLKTFELGGADGSLELPFLKAPEDWRQDSQPDSGSPAVDAGLGGFDDDDDILGGFDMANDVGFGDGGEAWAKEAALDPQMRVVNTIEGTNDSDNMDADGDGLEPGARYAFSIARGDEQQNILDYFDKALQKNWAGPEHWKIRRVKDAAKAATAGPAKRKEREPFEIDFMAPMSQSLADALYTPATTASSITMPKTQWRSKTRNLLPDDKHFHSRQLLRLFLKPNAIVGTSGRRKQIPEGRDIDEQYWANRNHEEEAAKNEADAQQANYDANFFQDDGFGMEPGLDEDDDVFADARDQLTPAMDGVEGQAVEGAAEPGQEGAFGEQLVTQSRRIRPEYVQYARVAKKVDVRRLKEEIWTKLAFEKPEEPATPTATSIIRAPDETLQFSNVINELQTVYPKRMMADISTSFCFICVLHLANEKGLVISNNDNFLDLTIRKDHTAEIVSGGE